MSLRQIDRDMCAAELSVLNDTTSKYGLALSRDDIAVVLESRDDALKRAGRVEFGTGVLAKLAYALCDSPYIQRDEYVETLCEAQSLFYHFKARYMERVTDDEIIRFMIEKYNGDCRGSLELLADLNYGKADK